MIQGGGGALSKFTWFIDALDNYQSYDCLSPEVLYLKNNTQTLGRNGLFQNIPKQPVLGVQSLISIKLYFELESWDVNLTFAFGMSSPTSITINSNEDDSKMVDWRV